MTENIRIGAVSYLNTKPLIHDLESLAPGAELVLDYPSRLADRMAQGELDCAHTGDRVFSRFGLSADSKYRHREPRARAERHPV